jgi:hypothetical protein
MGEVSGRNKVSNATGGAPFATPRLTRGHLTAHTSGLLPGSGPA